MVKGDLSKIKKDKEISDELSNKLVTLISTCIETHVTASGDSIGATASITQGDIDTLNIVAIDAAHQLQSIVKKSHNFTNVGKRVNT